MFRIFTLMLLIAAFWFGMKSERYLASGKCETAGGTWDGAICLGAKK